jgi:hypothetical protein
MPQLTMLEFIGQGIELVNHFLNYSSAPSLSTLHLVRLGKMPPKESVDVWDEFCIRHEKVFQRLKSLRVDLPAYEPGNPNKQQPLRYFFLVESLILDVVSDWQGGLEWLTEGTELPLPHLKSLEVKLHHMPPSPVWGPPQTRNGVPFHTKHTISVLVNKIVSVRELRGNSLDDVKISTLPDDFIEVMTSEQVRYLSRAGDR